MRGLRIAQSYDRVQYASLHHQRFYEDSGYSNFGWWEADTRSGRQAADNLVDRLLAPVAPAPADILDVACGQGGTTRRLCEHFPRAAVTAINASPRQLAAAQAVAPRGRFALMDAARLQLPDAAFDLVVCIEAAFHFDTREHFLREARRVLRPGGWLVMTDALSRLPRLDALLRRLRLPVLVPAGNHQPLAGYPALLARAGFDRIAVQEARAHTFAPYARAFLRSCARNLTDRALWPRIFFDPIQVPLLAPWLAFHHVWLAAYPLIWARRPEAA